jgi:hypothetical protein
MHPSTLKIPNGKKQDFISSSSCIKNKRTNHGGLVSSNPLQKANTSRWIGPNGLTRMTRVKMLRKDLGESTLHPCRPSKATLGRMNLRRKRRKKGIWMMNIRRMRKDISMNMYMGKDVNMGKDMNMNTNMSTFMNPNMRMSMSININMEKIVNMNMFKNQSQRKRKRNNRNKNNNEIHVKE